MVKLKKIDFSFDEELGRPEVVLTFEISELKRIDKMVLKWRLQEYDVIFEEEKRMELETRRFAKSKNILELIEEIREYIKEKKERIEKTLKEGEELKNFLNIINKEEAE